MQFVDRHEQVVGAGFSQLFSILASPTGSYGDDAGSIRSYGVLGSVSYVKRRRGISVAALKRQQKALRVWLSATDLVETDH